MASLNTSQNGPSITKSYQNVVNSPAPTGAAASSPTYGQWAVFAVQAPLVSAFQAGSGKESVLKVQSTGEGELVDLIDEFSDGRIQFAFVKVKDANSGLPKNVLIAWCGEGVPERTKGYFGSHLEAVSKLLHGYHVQVTARSDRDLTPESIIQKVADASGSKYAGGPSIPASSGVPPPAIGRKPVFQPTKVGGVGVFGSGAGGFNARSRAPEALGATDNDGWGQDAPQTTRTQLEKVESAYRPTKVDIAALQQQHRPSNYVPEPKQSNAPSDVVKGGYQPIGKIDINELRRQAKESGSAGDDRPTIVKGAYEPVGKVDIAAIRARAQGPGGAESSPSRFSPANTGENTQESSRSLADRSSAFQQSERLTSLPKPKVANKFGGSSTFTGTTAPQPGGFSAKSIASTAPVGAASKTFADEGGKTPAQVWAEKKARERGSSITSSTGGSTAPVATQPSGEGGWSSGYAGKKWGAVNTTHTGRSGVSSQDAGDREQQQEEEEPATGGGIGSIRDRFAAAPPPMDLSSKPNAGARSVPMPGLPSRPSGVPAQEHVSVPPPPAVPRSETPEPEDEEEDYGRPSSPIRVAMPVRRQAEPEQMEPADELHSPPPMPNASLAAAARSVPPAPAEDVDDEEESSRHAAQAAAASTFGHSAVTATKPQAASGGKRAIAQYDYEKAEDNEIELREGSYVTNIEMVDDDWWMGTNEHGEVGLFPSNYVELLEGEDDGPAASAPAPAISEQTIAAEPPAPPAGPAGGQAKKPTATAQYDYEAAEDNELSFPDGATITNLEFPDDDWWHGEYNGKTGLFPANYVQLDE